MKRGGEAGAASSHGAGCSSGLAARDFNRLSGIMTSSISEMRKMKWRVVA